MYKYKITQICTRNSIKHRTVIASKSKLKTTNNKREMIINVFGYLIKVGSHIHLFYRDVR